VIVLATIFMITYTSMAARFGVLNSKSMLQSMAAHYGRWFALLIGISAFLSTSSFQFGNNLGIGIGMEGITGINERVWPLIFTPLGIILIFWAKNLYRVLEKLMMFMVMIMIIAFFINLILTKPEITPLAKGFIPSKLSADSLHVVSALMATSFALPARRTEAGASISNGLRIWAEPGSPSAPSMVAISLTPFSLLSSCMRTGAFRHSVGPDKR